MKFNVGYAVAAAGNSSAGWYRYQNIRYAAPPTGNLRFAKPAWPPIESPINTGLQVPESIDCASTEDCLFLDVWTPANATGKKLPVLAFVYGGEFTSGSKTQATPQGLYELSQDLIFVGFNYRLGYAGLATGPSFQHQGGISNAGVWDVAHAMEWVKRYIGDFGGDGDRVTLSGFSAGASQVMFQLTRFSGMAEQLFQQAYIMSPGYVPGAGHYEAEAMCQNVSAALNCTGGDLACMRQVNFTTLIDTANDIANDYGYQLQPRVDEYFIDDTYEAQLYQKHFNFTGPLVISHERHEENSNNISSVTSDADIASMLREYWPAVTNDIIDEILTLYPLSHYAGQGYRFADIKQGLDMTGKNLALTQALNNETWNSIVNLGAATHGTDQFYYWYNPATGTSEFDGMLSWGTVDAGVAAKMQKYLLSFVLTGNPNTLWAEDKLYWPKYGNKTNTLLFNTTLSITTDDLANQKSLLWNKVLWY